MLINIDGKLLSPEQAHVSVFDRGFLYGDSVYEVIRTYRGIPFALEEHLARLTRSAEGLALEIPERAWLRAEIRKTIAAAGYSESYCRIVVTRGSGPLSLDPTTATKSCCVIYVKEYEPFPDWMYTKGIKLAIPSIRRNDPATINPAIKSGNYLNSVLALGEAKRAGFDDALMLGLNGQVTEASSASVFIYKDGLLQTPPLEAGILAGITRQLIIQLADEEKISITQTEFYPDDLYAADEVMLVSTLREVMPVVQVGDNQIASGQPGPFVKQLRQKFIARFT
jgi:branched-chain amino acid aminotransferase